MVSCGGLLWGAGLAARRPVRQVRRSDRVGSVRPGDSAGRSEHLFLGLVGR